MKTTKFLSALVFSLSSLAGCAATNHATAPATLAVPRATSSLEAVVDAPGPVTVDTVVSATWQVDRSGLIDLNDPKAKSAHLVDGLEPIDLFIHVIHHPQRGTFFVDSGVERAFVKDP